MPLQGTRISSYFLIDELVRDSGRFILINSADFRFGSRRFIASMIQNLLVVSIVRLEEVDAP